MLRVLTAVCLCLLLAAPFAGCGSNACDDACDKIEECGGTCTGDVNGGECTGQAECVAGCIADASCQELTDILNPQNPYLQCVGKCAQP